MKTSQSSFEKEKFKNGKGKQPNGSNNRDSSTPPSPRRSWIKMGSGRSRSVENMPPLAQQSPRRQRSKSPPLTLETGSPGIPGKADSKLIPVSPFDTPPKKTWEHNFRSFLSRRSQQHSSSFPEVPLMVPLHPLPSSKGAEHRHYLQQQQQQQLYYAPTQQHGKSFSSIGNGKSEKDDNLDRSVRGGKFFQTIFGGPGHIPKSRRRKTKSLNELDEPMRNGRQDRICSPHSTTSIKTNSIDLGRRVQSQANFFIGNGGDDEEEDELNQTLRRATYAGTSTGAAIVPPPLQQPHHIHQQFFHPHDEQQQQGAYFPQEHQQRIYSLHDPNNPFATTTTDYIPYSTTNGMSRLQHQVPYVPQPHHYRPQQHQQPLHPHHPNSLGPLPTPPSGLPSPIPSGASSQYSMSPSSATTEFKKAFTEFHNSSRYARDSTSAYLGDEPSTRQEDNFSSAHHCSLYNPGLVVQQNFGAGPQTRNYTNGSIGSGINHRFLSSSLPTVDENVSIHKSMRMLRPFQTVDCWQSGRRYLIGPAALAACPLLQGLSSLSLSSSSHTRNMDDSDSTCNADEDSESQGIEPNTEKKEESEITGYSGDKNAAFSSPTELPALFGCIVLGKALLSYVVQEPMQHHQQRWWSSCILVLRQNYLLEYDQTERDVLQGLPRGYAHLQYSHSYANPDFLDALELEFFVSPCAKADKRVLTIRLEEAREKRNNWIACLNRAAKLGIKDLYEFDDSSEIGRGRYAGVYPAKRRGQSCRDGKAQSTANCTEEQRNDQEKSLSSQVLQTVPTENYDCALKIIDKKEFWRRVVKGRERADTLVRETSVQATMTTKCSKIPAFVRLRGFFETSDHVVLELELMEGMDLFQYVSSKGVLAEKEAAYILRDILGVLDGMNRAGLAHRDIKPANCLMCKNDNKISPEEAPCIVKVADFGMSTFVGLDGLVRGRCGTPGYVAPEIFSAGMHGGYGNKVDVFSAGVTLYVMLCGYEPFYGESDAELVAANKEAKLEFPKSDWKHVSTEAKNLVKSMMEPDPKMRLSAKDSLSHPWIIQHAGNTEIANVTGNSGSSNSGSCVIS